MSAADDDGRDKARAQLKRPGPPREHRRVGGQVSDLVVDDERCDREFEDAEARRRRDEWDASQDDRLKAREATRRQMTLGQRLDVALTEIERGKGIRARPIASSRASGAEDSPGGRRPSHVSGPEIEQALTLIDHHVKRIERELDADLGLVKTAARAAEGKVVAGSTGALSSARLRGSDERDRIVWEDFEGIRADQVAEEAPYLGTSARTIERAREREAAKRGVRVRLVDGVVLGKVEGKAA